jgi:hypothetical protein
VVAIEHRRVPSIFELCRIQNRSYLQAWSLEHLSNCTTSYHAFSGIKVELRSPSHLPNFKENKQNLVVVRLPKGALHAGPDKVAGSKHTRTLFCLSGDTVCKPKGAFMKDYNKRMQDALLCIHEIIVRAETFELARMELIKRRKSLVQMMDKTTLGHNKWQPWGGPSHQAFSDRFFAVLITQPTKIEMLGHLWQSHTTIEVETDIHEFLQRRDIVIEVLNAMELEVQTEFSYTVLDNSVAASLLQTVDKAQALRVGNYLDFYYRERHPKRPRVTIESVSDIPSTSKYFRQGEATTPDCQNPCRRISSKGFGIPSAAPVGLIDFVVNEALRSRKVDMELTLVYPIIAAVY